MLIARSSWTIWDGRRDVCLLNLYKWYTVHGPLTLPVPPHPSKSRKPRIHFSFPRGIPGCLPPSVCVYQLRLFLSLFPIITFLRPKFSTTPVPFVTRSFHHVSIPLLPSSLSWPRGTEVILQRFSRDRPCASQRRKPGANFNSRRAFSILRCNV